MIYAQQAATFESSHDVGISGLVGTIAFRIEDGQGAVVAGPSTANVVESPGDAGIYTWSRAAPATIGQYVVVSSTDGTFDVGTVALDELVVVEAETVATLPPIPTAEGIATYGFCQAWVSADDIAESCPSFTGGTDPEQIELLEPWAVVATEVLFEISGRVFKGECGPIVVRPCADSCGCWSILNRSIGGWGWEPYMGHWACGDRSCGCSPLSEIQLSGWPREIVEVKIDGDVIDASDYRLDPTGKLVHMRDPTAPNQRLSWPGCQIIDLDDTEEGTFSVEYTYGLDPPQSGRSAALALACQLYAASIGSGRCKLPERTRQVARAGITIEIGGMIAESLKAGATGILVIDAFVAAHGDSGEDASVWSPDLPPAPRRMA